MAQKQNIRNFNKSKDEAKIIAVPNLVFRPFKNCRWIVVALSILSMAICAGLFFHVVFLRDIIFVAKDLRETANVALDITLVVGALGLSIFLLPIKSEQKHKEKEKLLFRYVGNILVLTSVTILGYIISYCTKLLPSMTLGVYSIVMLIALSSCLIRTVSTMVAYFNIRD